MALLLDDSEWVLQDLGDRLRRRGYVVHTSATTDQAERIAKSETLDLVVVDLKLDYRSEFGGLDFIRFLKRNQPRTKVVVLSGHDEGVVPDDFPRSDIDLWVSKTDPAGSYLDLVSNGIARFEAQAAKKRCFVIMPMSKSASCSKTEWEEVYTRAIKPTVESCGYTCTRSKGVAGNIIKLILDDLNRADLVVADLTDRNANVFYELGVRHALRDWTVLLAQNIDRNVPFDLRPYSVIEYDWKTEAGKDALKAGLQAARPRPVQPPPGCRRADLPPENCTDFSVSPLLEDTCERAISPKSRSSRCSGRSRLGTKVADVIRRVPRPAQARTEGGEVGEVGDFMPMRRPGGMLLQRRGPIPLQTDRNDAGCEG